MSAESTILVPWSEAFRADPFVILCVRFPEGEQFMVVPAESGNRTTLEEMGLPVGGFVTETDVRIGVTRTGLAEADVTTRIQLARAWATTVGRTASFR